MWYCGSVPCTYIGPVIAADQTALLASAALKSDVLVAQVRSPKTMASNAANWADAKSGSKAHLAKLADNINALKRAA